MAGVAFYQMIGLDSHVRPLHKKLDKKTFYDFADLNKKEKDYITKYVERIEVTYVLTPSNMNIQPFINEEYHYEGVMFITIRLREEAKDTHVSTISEVIQGALPNPVVIMFTKKENIQVHTCIKRRNKVDRSQAVLEQQAYTPWFQLDERNETVQQFIRSVHMKNVSFAHFFQFYQDIHLAVQAFQHTNVVGTFYIVTNEQSQQLIAQIKQLETEIAAWKANLKKETQFNRKVEMNMNIHKLTTQIEQLKQRLK
ncbi:DUF4391 domain-containing protein [Anoxybacillus sp. J5B_2022]|uniref:DUF4391 domain-containing protein n=1 Tax=Anoxybacillus sp. J5B_2022 TaxID=3003246 RepID=UPI00228690A1|nr:DUF4391 domain-containing protein [Anoxybacillus sp. J5B_2022]MCZ0754196.1 DUF4391 domain-containing protein [Anoxybacillus sp. J5B_2022]